MPAVEATTLKATLETRTAVLVMLILAKCSGAISSYDNHLRNNIIAIAKASTTASARLMAA